MSVIAILLPDLRGGGAERVSLDLAQEFASSGHEVNFYLMREVGEFLPLARYKYRVFNLNVEKIRNVPAALAGLLRERRPDVLIANMWPLTSAAVIARWLAKLDCRLLLVEHSTLSRAYAKQGVLHNVMMRLSLMATYPFADHVAGVSHGVASDIARLARLSRCTVNILYNPIFQNHTISQRSLERVESLWRCPRGERILAVGSMKDAKNYPLLLSAFAQLSRSSAKLMILGKGEGESSLRAIVQKLAIEDRIIFAGFHSDPSSFYATADLFVLSSDYEGLPTVLIEALSFGLPVVSTDCPSGPAEILESGRWGRLVPVCDVNALAAAMDETLSMPTDREALKRRAADFAPELAASKYLDLLGL